VSRLRLYSKCHKTRKSVFGCTFACEVCHQFNNKLIRLRKQGKQVRVCQVCLLQKGKEVAVNG
jgi:hypothetical protein